MRLSIGEAARRSGVSVRTLRYYDKIGLLSPSEVSEAGYRFYDVEAVSGLQQILFYKELGFSLEEIRRIIRQPDADRTEALARHRTLLLLRRRRLDAQIRLVEQVMGGKGMKKNPIETDDYEAVKARYAEETRRRWGDTAAYAEQQQKESGRTAGQNAAMMEEMREIFAEFSRLKNEDPAGSRAQAAVARLQAYITRHHYHCTPEILSSLGEIYVADPRFTENIDREGTGTALFVREAIRVFCRIR